MSGKKFQINHSIRGRKDGGAFKVDPRSTKNAVQAFRTLTSPLQKFSVQVNPFAPHGDAVLAAEALKKLCEAYPGYTWVVEVDDRPNVGMMNIYNQDINAELSSNAPYGYRLYLSNVYGDPSLKIVVEKGGEILERAHLKRGKNTGETPKSVEGVKESHQPLAFQMEERRN